MKISRRELDSTILEKLDQLDNVADTYDETNPDGFVSYGPNGFYFKKTNDTFLKKVYDENDLVSLEKSLLSTDRNITSSLLKDIRLDNKTNMATMSFLYNLDFNNIYEYSSIYLKKIFNDTNYVIDKEGNIYFNENIIEFINLIKDQFNISDNFSVGDIVDFCFIDGTTLIIATNNFGIFKLKLLTKEIELITIINRVRRIEISHMNTLFIATDNFCALIDIETGNYIEKFYNIVNSNQIPIDILKTEDGIFVISAQTGFTLTNQLVHFFKLDKGKVGYNIKDGLLEKHPLDGSYQILYSLISDNKLFLSGKVNNKLPFVWTYSLDDLSFNEEILSCKEVLGYDGFLEVNGYYILLSKSDLYIIKNNTIFSHYKLKANCKTLSLKNGEILSQSGHYIISFSLLKFEKKNDNLMFSVYDGEDACNNIDIFIKNATRNERISLIDEETGKMINPSFYMVYNNNTIIKLMNCKSKKIKMIVSVNEDSFIEGIVIRNNRIFLR